MSDLPSPSTWFPSSSSPRKVSTPHRGATPGNTVGLNFPQPAPEPQSVEFEAKYQEMPQYAQNVPDFQPQYVPNGPNYQQMQQHPPIPVAPQMFQQQQQATPTRSKRSKSKRSKSPRSKSPRTQKQQYIFGKMSLDQLREAYPDLYKSVKGRTDMSHHEIKKAVHDMLVARSGQQMAPSIAPYAGYPYPYPLPQPQPAPVSSKSTQGPLLSSVTYVPVQNDKKELVRTQVNTFKLTEATQESLIKAVENVLSEEKQAIHKEQLTFEKNVKLAFVHHIVQFVTKLLATASMADSKSKNLTENRIKEAWRFLCYVSASPPEDPERPAKADAIHNFTVGFVEKQIEKTLDKESTAHLHTKAGFIISKHVLDLLLNDQPMFRGSNPLTVKSSALLFLVGLVDTVLREWVRTFLKSYPIDPSQQNKKTVSVQFDVYKSFVEFKHKNQNPNEAVMMFSLL